MRSPAICVSFSDHISVIIDKMIKNDIGSIIVLHNQKPIGIITESDILKRVLKQHKINEIYAKDIMSSPIFTIEYDNDLPDALKLMREKHVRRLAITKNGDLIGIVTERRLLNAQICPGLMKITL